MSKELGDFQTPPALVTAVIESLNSTGKKWSRVLEPACGRGNFIKALLNLPIPPREIHAIELQSNYVKIAEKIAAEYSSTRVLIQQRKLFDLDLSRDLQWRETGSLLVVGNPPWVTNSQLGIEGSTNLPKKTNLKNFRGIDALTGSSNFDIAEYIWLKLIRELAFEEPTIALLCKTTVARKVLQFAYDNDLPITSASIRIIDTKKWFGAAVSACLFSVEIGSGKPHYEAAVYQNLYTTEPESTISIAGGQLVADLKAYNRLAFVDGVCPLTWRQGIKHDAASVMELAYDKLGCLHNKLGETIIVEPEYTYPLLKSTDLFHQLSVITEKAVIVTQKHLGENTYQLQQVAPKLWSYLTAHFDTFDRRKSSIYRGKPPFSMFGIGEYSFAPYKVGISGLHKTPKFRAIGPVNCRPVMLDDTCYFIPCYSPEQAAFLTTILSHPICLDFIYSQLFSDAKRPITKKLLQRLNLKEVYDRIEFKSLLSQANIEFERLTTITSKQKAIWPSSLEELLER
ncbi:MAG: SAM-dependent methyltransferase [bacterium]|nr:SAM-dependent methyltransferase [bacterium]